MSAYAESIAKISDRDPRHIEGWLRLQFGTLDHLDPHTFKREVRLAEECIAAEPLAESEDLARSFGL